MNAEEAHTIYGWEDVTVAFIPPKCFVIPTSSHAPMGVIIFNTSQMRYTYDIKIPNPNNFAKQYKPEVLFANVGL